jgi:hypothetical protein
MHWVVRFNPHHTFFHERKNAPPSYEGECTVVEVSTTGELSLPKVAKPIYLQLNKSVKGVEIKSYRYQIYADEGRDRIEKTSSVSVPVIMRIIEPVSVEKRVNECDAHAKTRKRRKDEAGEGSGQVRPKSHQKECVHEGAGSGVIGSQESASCDSMLSDCGSDMSDY